MYLFRFTHLFTSQTCITDLPHCHLSYTFINNESESNRKNRMRVNHQTTDILDGPQYALPPEPQPHPWKEKDIISTD